MAAIGILAICLSCSLCLYLVLALIRQLNRLWWTPIRIQHQMHSQGINGPPYKFFYGSNKDVSNMKKEAMVKPMDLSHDILYKAQPHIHAWIKKYGKKKKNSFIVILNLSIFHFLPFSLVQGRIFFFGMALNLN